ncbi:spore coat protein GerQ [Metabacillus herbersteinensis]|uniref:Spore coat protein GerQ n=1 Tax=Metabacillus herbersteinensis TaxID=283816 RepID=A0ABV6GLD0_9BACI
MYPNYGTTPTGFQQFYTGVGYQTPALQNIQPQVPVAHGVPAQTFPAQLGQQVPGMLPLEESYIENILRLNKGKLATVYATFENNQEWNAKVFKGIIEAAGRDHLILSDPQTGQRILLPMIYLDYVTFDEEIEYEYPFAPPRLSMYRPR